VKLLGVSCENVKLLHGWAEDIKAYYKMENFPITLLADEDRAIAFK
jgi:alkyl hydroperoxide reductase subunit AhpC